MNVEIIEEEKNFLKLKFDEPILANLLREEVLKDKSVEFASYDIPHPMEKNVILVIKTVRKKPRDVLKSAIEKLSKKFKDFEKALK